MRRCGKERGRRRRSEKGRGEEESKRCVEGRKRVRGVLREGRE